MSFRIVHSGPDLWIVESEKVIGWWPFRRSRWDLIGSYKTEAEAFALVKQRANFEPHTSYYDRYGNMLIEGTDW